MGRYFTVEFLCDDLEQAQELCKELQDKYDIACCKESGVRISSWKDGAMDDSYKEKLWFLQRNREGYKFWDSYVHPGCAMLKKETFQGNYIPFNPPKL